MAEDKDSDPRRRFPRRYHVFANSLPRFSGNPTCWRNLPRWSSFPISMYPVRWRRAWRSDAKWIYRRASATLLTHFGLDGLLPWNLISLSFKYKGSPQREYSAARFRTTVVDQQALHFASL